MRQLRESRAACRPGIRRRALAFGMSSRRRLWSGPGGAARGHFSEMVDQVPVTDLLSNGVHVGAMAIGRAVPGLIGGPVFPGPRGRHLAGGDAVPAYGR